MIHGSFMATKERTRFLHKKNVIVFAQPILKV